MIRTGSYTGSVQSKIGLIEYTVKCEADYSYDPGCYRTKNGDGWPPSEEFDDLTLINYKEYTVYDDNGNDITDTLDTNIIEHAIKDDFENVSPWDCDWDEPDYPEPPEPEDWDE